MSNEIKDHPTFYIRHAAKMMEVSVKTVRRWSDAGKIPYHRNPMNNWRFYELRDINWYRKAVGKRPLSVEESIKIYDNMR